MSGYLVIPRHALDLYGGAVPAAPGQIGFLDFLREIEQDPFPFPPRARLCITGLDDLLIALNCTDKRGTPQEHALVQDYKRRLKLAAVEISQLADIQVPVTYPLILGGEKKLSSRNTPLDLVPLWRLFGHNPSPHDIVAGKIFGYHFGENLS
jgi:hypothetical protein